MVETGVVLVSLVEGVPEVVGVPDGVVEAVDGVVESVVVGVVVVISPVMRVKKKKFLRHSHGIWNMIKHFGERFMRMKLTSWQMAQHTIVQSQEALMYYVTIPQGFRSILERYEFIRFASWGIKYLCI